MGIVLRRGAAVSKGFRQSQSTLHTWSGLLLGWVLFLVFLCGTIAFWREGMNRYMRPELARVEQPMRVLAGAQAFLQDKAPDAKSWFVAMPNSRMPGSQLFWQPQPKEGEEPRRGRRGRGDTQALIGADGQIVQARETKGGEFFYRFHFDLYYMPVIWARWLVGVAAMMMLVAILSGIVTHKKIFRDFFTLRRQKGQRSWLDGHNASAVLALPFHLMITYTGMVTLMAMLMPWAVVANYTDREKLSDALFPSSAEVERAGKAAPLVKLAQLVTDAERRLGVPAGFIQVSEPGDASARVTVNAASSATLSSRTASVTYDGTNGALVWQSPPSGPAATTAGVMIGLHAGRYADIALRWIYFLCGMAGTLMVASGLVLWTVKRREKLPDPSRPHLGFRVVERLNVAVIGGFPFAIACMFWANRLLPVGMTGRADWEVHSLFICWGLAFIFVLFRKPALSWVALLGATGVLLAVLPFYNLLRFDQNLLTPFRTGDLLPAGVDLFLLFLGAAFAAVARRVANHATNPAKGRAPRRAKQMHDFMLEPAE